MNIRNLTIVFCLVSFISLHAQNTPRGLNDLIGMKAAYLDDNLSERGYSFIKNDDIAGLPWSIFMQTNQHYYKKHKK